MDITKNHSAKPSYIALGVHVANHYFDCVELVYYDNNISWLDRQCMSYTSIVQQKLTYVFFFMENALVSH